jgi:hypothetical protein
MTCEKCEKKAHSFDLQCHGCRDRLVMGIDCKVLREIEAKYLDMKFGFLPDYKREPNCGCKTTCLRKSRLREQ